MKVILDYYDRVNYTSIKSEIKSQKEIESDTKINIFEQFYKLNNS